MVDGWTTSKLVGLCVWGGGGVLRSLHTTNIMPAHMCRCNEANHGLTHLCVTSHKDFHGLNVDLHILGSCGSKGIARWYMLPILYTAYFVPSESA